MDQLGHIGLCLSRSIPNEIHRGSTPDEFSTFSPVQLKANYTDDLSHGLPLVSNSQAAKNLLSMFKSYFSASKESLTFLIREMFHSWSKRSWVRSPKVSVNLSFSLWGSVGLAPKNEGWNFRRLLAPPFAAKRWKDFIMTKLTCTYPFYLALPERSCKKDTQ
jgi:hypothetical protein